jgi:hypothetical protein
MALQVRRQWLDCAVHPEKIEYVFAIDDDDAKSVRLLADYSHVVAPAGGRMIRPINMGARVATGDILITAMDDVVAPKDWDSSIRERLPSPRETHAVLAVSDGHRKDRLLVTYILTRPRYESQANILDPAYELYGVYVDNEFTDRAYRDKVVIEAFDLVFEHDHPSFRGGELDEIYQRHNNPECYRLGYDLYKKRNG